MVQTCDIHLYLHALDFAKLLDVLSSYLIACMDRTCQWLFAVQLKKTHFDQSLVWVVVGEGLSISEHAPGG